MIPIRFIVVGCMLVGMAFTSCSKDKGDTTTQVAPKVAPIDKNWAFETTPVWADEFDYTGKPDSSKWGYDIGGTGWGNHELEYYTNSIANSSVANGVLTITAKKENYGGQAYTAARLVTTNKGDWLYGRIEVKAQLPAGKGTWPAIWILPTDWIYGNWPNSGEVDMMEHVGYDPDNIHITAHTLKYNFKINTQKTASKIIPSATTAFHLYRLDWTPYALRGYIDDTLVFTFVNDGNDFESWPFDARFHLLLNLAIGGDWGGAQGMDDSIYPVSMLVDYVRVYKMIDK
jgi:beta-glucanase (GH16 family)